MLRIDDLRRAIFPVFRHEVSRETEGELRARGGDFLGTGFFVSVNGWVVFVTARHVADQARPRSVVGIGDLRDNAYHVWGGFDLYKTDVAAAVFKASEAPTFARPFPLAGELHGGIGEEVYSFGYPFSGAKEERGSQTLVHVEEMLFRGHIAALYDGEELRGVVSDPPFEVNVGLSFSCPQGLSGAPLLAVENGEPVVIGMVYGNRAVEFQIERTEEVESDGRVERTRVVRTHHVGLATRMDEIIGAVFSTEPVLRQEGVD